MENHKFRRLAVLAAVSASLSAIASTAFADQAHFTYRNTTSVPVYISLDGRQVLTVMGGQTQDLYFDAQTNHSLTYSSGGRSVTLGFTAGQTAPEEKCTLDTGGVRCGPDFPPPR